MSQVIEAKFVEFVGKNAMFTSMDIANSIKESGEWIRNSEVGKWLRENALKLTTDYSSTKISVAQGQHTAFLYYPTNSDPDDYKDRDQIALQPIQQTQVSSQSPISCSTSLHKIKCDSRSRLWIPSNLVKQLGWGSGDKVDKNKILVNQQDVSEDLIVRNDGRISIPRKCIAWGTDPVNVFVSNGNLCFQKA